MKTNSFSIKEAEAYLRKEGFSKITKKQTEMDEWKNSIQSVRDRISI